MGKIRPIKTLKEVGRRVQFYFCRGRFDRELKTEMRFHLEMKARDNAESGLTAKEAAWAAHRQIGNVTLLHERSRDMWTLRWVETLSQDARYSLRVIKRSPVLVTAIVLSLGLAIGANTAVFSIVNDVILKTLPVKEPSKLVLFSWDCARPSPAHSVNGNATIDASGRTVSTSFSQLEFDRMRSDNRTLSDLFAFADLGDLNVNADGNADVASGEIVSGNYYQGLDVQALVGRTLSDDDDKPTADATAVISYQFWRDRFAFDRSVIGKSIYLNGVPFIIVGVTSAEFSGTSTERPAPDVTVPLSTEPRIHWSAGAAPRTWRWWLTIMGRLKAGVSREESRTNFTAAFQQAALQGHRDYVARNPELASAGEGAIPRLVVQPGGQGLRDTRGTIEKQLSVLTIVVALVLLIACANAASLLLARANARRREIAVRIAMGAGRLRLIRQLLTESLTLAAIAGVLGTVLAYWGKDLLVGLIQGGASARLAAGLDIRVLAFTAGVSFLTGLVFGIAPALHATRVDLTPTLKESTSANTAGGFGFGLGKSLVVVQVAVSLVLLVGAGLFLRTLHNLEQVGYGFDANNLLLFRLDPTQNGYKGQRLANLYEQLSDKLDSIPGVLQSGCSEEPLLAPGQADLYGGLVVPESKAQVPEDRWVYANRVSATFFETMKVPILLGRDFSRSDAVGARQVAVVNQSFAKLYFPDKSPIGKQFKFSQSDNETVEIVGLAADARYDNLRGPIPPTFYQPYRQDIDDLGGLNFAVRTGTDPSSLVPAVRLALRTLDPNLAISGVKTQIDQIDQSLSKERFFADFTVAFSSLALFLSCLGLYGVMSYSVSRRTNEIGIRMALGADSGAVLRQIMRETMLMVIGGVVLGTGASLAATRVVSSMLFGLSRNDPATIAIAAGVLSAVAAIAGFVPARRAARIEPMRALRYE